MSTPPDGVYARLVGDTVGDGWDDLTRWWDSVELWLTGLWAPVQIALVIGVLLPVCWLVAFGIDRGIDRCSDFVSARFGSRDAEHPDEGPG